VAGWSGGWLEGDGVSEGFEPGDELPDLPVGVQAAGEVAGAEFVVGLILLHDGRTVTARATSASWPPPSQTPVAVGQTAQRYGIPADLAGAIKRDSFPAALLGAAETIRVTIRDGVDVGEAILDVIERTEPVEPGDILALSHHGTDMEVVATRQIFTGGSWEQVAWVRYYL
jgi:hypothetical protein